MDIAWIYGLSGGLLIGCAGAALLLRTGQIMGASGIVGGLVDGTGADRGTTVAFLFGLITMPALMTTVTWSVDTHVTQNVALLILGGLAVGVGTRFANGCTSGPGVCGMGL